MFNNPCLSSPESCGGKKYSGISAYLFAAAMSADYSCGNVERREDTAKCETGSKLAKMMTMLTAASKQKFKISVPILKIPPTQNDLT